MLGIGSNIEGIEGEEGKENAKFVGMEEVFAEMKIEDNYTTRVVLSTRLFVQHFCSFGHAFKSLKGHLGFFQLHSCKLILHFVVVMFVVCVIYASRYCF